MDKQIFLSLEDVSELTGKIPETVRRKCKNGTYVSTFTKDGRFKKYSILLQSLPKEAQRNYLSIKDKIEQEDNINKTIVADENATKYANAPLWARKQADKYLLLFNKTQGMTHKQIEEFIKQWNKRKS